jgi:glycosyltransferase involved in cell wall biosynthesis
MKLAWISELTLQPAGGGAYAVNCHAFRQMGRHFETVYCGPVEPRVPLVTDWVSKLRRKVLKRPGKFAHFSPTALERNATRVAQVIPDDAEAVYFRAAAPWCRCRPQVPYFIYLDVVFHTFFRNTFRPGDFEAGDLKRIWREEATFLEGAAAVFFESRWGLEQAREVYGLRGDHYHAPGRGGGIDPPAADVWDGSSQQLVTMAMKFRQKGGDLVMAAYRSLKPRFPGLTWHIIGGPPEDGWQELEGVVYEGELKPDEPADLARFRELLAGAFLFVHPTREDTSPLVLTEAAYFGCPAVSVRRFAIPELVRDGETGILVEFPTAAEPVAAAIAGLLEDAPRYRRMRVEARRQAVERCSWERIGETMTEEIRRHLR